MQPADATISGRWLPRYCRRSAAEEKLGSEDGEFRKEERIARKSEEQKISHKPRAL